MKFKNMSEVTVKIPGFEPVAAGDIIEVPADIASPTRNANDSRRMSPIEMLAPQMRPADDDELAQWLLTPEPKALEKAAAPTVEGLVKVGQPRKVAEAMVKAYHLAAAAEIDAVAAPAVVVPAVDAKAKK